MRRADVVGQVDSYTEELATALYAAEEAGIQIDAASSEITGRHGDYNSIKTEADERSDTAIRRVIGSEYPEDGLVSEEGEDVEGDRVWAVDPLDGTTNFENGEDHWSVAIGLIEDGEPVMSVVHSPEAALGRTYFAARDGGAYRLEDGVLEALEVSDRDLSGSIVISKLADFYTGEWERDVRVNEALKEHEANIRVYNSGALENCMVAEGVAAGFISHIEGVWDSVTASLVVEEAGGETRVRNTHQDKPEWEENREVVASNGVVQEQLEQLAEQHLE
jgi:fructose-1,6-bisphosphatase/inositol monophosphatase family enzyme